MKSAHREWHPGMEDDPYMVDDHIKSVDILRSVKSSSLDSNVRPDVLRKKHAERAPSHVDGVQGTAPCLSRSSFDRTRWLYQHLARAKPDWRTHGLSQIVYRTQQCIAHSQRSAFRSRSFQNVLHSLRLVISTGH